MKKTRRRTLFFLFFTLLMLSLLFTACGQKAESGGEEPPISGTEDSEETPLGDENPDITHDYLTSQYAQQLLDDGAEHYFGSVEVYMGTEDQMLLVLHEKEKVADDNEPNGYRLVEYAAVREFELPEYAEVLFLPGSATEHEILTGSEFFIEIQKDFEEYSTDFEEYGNFKLYDVYVIDNQVMLLIAHYLV